jgi:ATP-binding protein involved in chromosome partitioning
VSFRTYHEVPGDDRSRLGAQVASQRRRVRDRMAGIRRVVAVASGKGGVGKSHVTAAVARCAAAMLPGGVGVLDADLHGPTIPRLLGARGPLRVDAAGIVEPAVGHGGVRVVSTALLLEVDAPLAWRGPDEEAFVWRGALEAGTLRELLGDVAWGPLDLLLVDLPPGGERLRDLAALARGMAGAVAVTIPSEESRAAVARSMRSAAAAGIPLLGVVENMSGRRCRACGAAEALFEGDAGASLARDFGVPLLARIPFATADGDADAAQAVRAATAALLERIA